MENCQPVESITAVCKPNNSGADDAGKNSDSMNPELMSIDHHCRKMDDSHLVDVAVSGDSVNVIKAVEVSTVKRKRGRPPKDKARIMSSSSTAPPPPRRKKDEDEEEDVCFICFDGGSLVLCDRHGCPKAYHPACIKRDEAFFKSKAKWNCGWHICSTCQKASYYMCYTCTYSLCKNCTKDADYVNVRGNKGFCGLCLRTIMLIENSTLSNKEMVDFDDKTSWEYLFKVYWIFLKGKLSLSVDELTKAKNPWKENATGDLGASFSKRRKMLKQQTFLNNVQSVEAGKPGITTAHSRPTDTISQRSEVVATQLAVLGNSDGPPIIERSKTHKKVDDKGQKANPDEFAAIDVHNMNLIYLKRNLMENLIDDIDKFYDKVVGSLVRIRIPGSDQKQDTYRLVKVVGTIKMAEPYKIGEKTIYVMIEILNLDKKEVVSIDRISNQDFSEDECQQLRQSIIKSGQIKWFTVGEIQEKAMALQAVRVNDWLESEISQVKNLCGQASEKGDMKELRECEEKLQLLISPAERHRRIHEIPDIHRDPNRNLFCKSEEVSGELDEKKKGMELSANNIETDKIWHYQDPLGKIQGPFPMAMLRGWNNSGHFPSDLRIWRVSDKQADSILLIDALVGRYSQAQQLFHNSFMPTEDVRIAPKDGRKNRDGDIGESRDPQVNQMQSKQVEGSLNPMQSDASGHCHSNKESANSKEPGSQSSTCIASSGIVDPNAAQTGSSLPHWDSMKGDNYFPGQPQVSSSLPTSTLTGKPCETQSNQVSKGHGIERHCGLIDMNVNLNKTSEGQNIDGNVKQDDNEGKSGKSGKSSGVCWRAPPLNDASNGWDSNSGLLYLARALEVSEHNQDTDFPDLPTSTSKLNHEDSKGQATKSKQSLSLNVPHLDSGPSWSNASSLVGNGAQLPEVAGEWGGYTSNSAGPSVGEWNLELVPKSSMKPTDMGSDHAATPTSGSGQLTHSSPTDPANNESGWNSIVPEPNEYSLGDESVSDLLAEVEAMESLNGLASPTSIIRGDGDLAQGSEPDCFSPVGGLSPAHDPRKSDTLPSLLALTNELFGITKSEDAQKSSGGHSSTSVEMDDDTRPSDVSVNQYEAGSDKQPRAAPPAATWSMATVGTAWSAGPETTGTDWGVVQGNGNFHWEGLGQGTTNISWETDHGTIHENRSSIRSATSAGSPAYFGNQQGYGDLRDQQRYVDPRDQNRYIDPRDRDSRGRDSSFSRDRTSWNRHSSSNGGGPPNRVGSLRPPPKGQRVCKFYESGYCNRGASCSYWHP